MTPDELRAAFRRFQAALLDPDTLPEILADHFVAHDLPPDTDFVEFRRGVMRFIPDEQPARVRSGRSRIEPLHRSGYPPGRLHGCRPDWQGGCIRSVRNLRFDDDGKAVERWALIDIAGLMRQVGLTRLP